MKIKDKLAERLRLVAMADANLFYGLSDLPDAQGYSEDYLISMGLEKGDLKRLERVGLALRGRLPTKQGHRVRWVLLREVAK